MNELYPIFLKTNNINILIVGGGFVALEKLTFLLKSSPNANVSLVSISFIDDVKKIIAQHNFEFKVKSYDVLDVENKGLVIGATNDELVNRQIYKDCKQKNILVNIADNPKFCDFYMGGIVTKGNLKLAISTNGKSPTMAKRLRQLFEQILPDSMDEVFEKLNSFRETLKDDFEFKVEELNKLTTGILSDKNLKEKNLRKWKRKIRWNKIKASLSFQ